jgi:hypothetical protein
LRQEVLSRQEVILKSLRDEISHEKISKSNIQLDLKNKEECAQELIKTHRRKIDELRQELDESMSSNQITRAQIARDLMLIGSE